MSHNDIDNPGTVPPAGFTIPVGDVGAPPPQTTPSGSSDRSTSTISPSDASMEALVQDPANPFLDQPSPSNIAALFSQKQDEIIQSVLDKWLEGIQENNRRIREELRSPKYLNWVREHSPAFFAEMDRKLDKASSEFAVMNSPEYLSWVASLAPKDRDRELAYKDNVGQQIGPINAAASYVEATRHGKIEASAAIPLVAASIAIGMTETGRVVTAKEIGNITDITSTAFKEMWDKTTANLPMEIPPDMGIIAALFMVRQTAETMAMSVSGGQGGKQADLKQFANDYAKLVMQLVGKKDLDNIGKDVLAGKTDRPEEGVALLKVSFLATAMALLYKADTGDTLNGEKFAALLNTREPPKESDTLGVLATLMRFHLSSLPADTRVRVIENLMAYMDTKPKVEDKMAEAAKLYASLMQEIPLDERPIEA